MSVVSSTSACEIQDKMDQMFEVKVLMSTGQVVCTLPGSSSTDPSETSRAICRRC
jgi:hypothetical protein